MLKLKHGIISVIKAISTCASSGKRMRFRTFTDAFGVVRATSHLKISMHGQRETGKIQSNNYHHGNCRPPLRVKCHRRL